MDRKQYWAIKNALTKTEKELIEFYNFNWLMRGYVPTVEEVAERLRKVCKNPKIGTIEVNYYLKRKPVQVALNQRGIKWQQQSREELTPTQVATGSLLANFADTRSNELKLDSLGVNPQQYQAWLKDPQFQQYVESLANDNINNIKPTALNEFTKLINKGDWNAIKYYIETTNALHANDMPESEALLRMLIEILQEEVQDPVVLGRIADRIKMATQNRTLERATQPAIEAQIVDDPELEEAKKVLGIG